MSVSIDEYDSSAMHKIKVVLLGDRGVGKSSIIHRFMDNQFHDFLNATVGIDFMTKKLIFKGKSVKLEVWDTAGQQKFKSLVRGYLKGADACVFVYDILCTNGYNTEPETYEHIEEWLELFNSTADSSALKLIVGNKMDKIEQNTISERKKKYEGIPEIRVSAKTAENVEEIFQRLLQEYFKGKKTSKTLASQKLTQADLGSSYWSCCGN